MCYPFFVVVKEKIYYSFIKQIKLNKKIKIKIPKKKKRKLKKRDSIKKKMRRNKCFENEDINFIKNTFMIITYFL